MSADRRYHQLVFIWIRDPAMFAEYLRVLPPIVARYAKRPVAEVFHGTFPHFIAHLVAIAILVAFPSIILWLPSQMGR